MEEASINAQIHPKQLRIHQVVVVFASDANDCYRSGPMEIGKGLWLLTLTFNSMFAATALQLPVRIVYLLTSLMHPSGLRCD